jgi:hypothetical protein
MSEKADVKLQVVDLGEHEEIALSSDFVTLVLAFCISKYGFLRLCLLIDRDNFSPRSTL